MTPEHDLEYYQLRLSQLYKHLKQSGKYEPMQETLKNLHYCQRKIEQCYRKEIVLCKENEVMY